MWGKITSKNRSIQLGKRRSGPDRLKTTSMASRRRGQIMQQKRAGTSVAEEPGAGGFGDICGLEKIRVEKHEGATHVNLRKGNGRRT